MWHGYYGVGGWWMMGIGMLFWLVVLALIVWAVSRGSIGVWHRREGESNPDPVTLLKKRYARGEIDQDEYERIRRDLEKG